MEEKKRIEKSVAEKFLNYYNKEYNTSYKIIKLSENPDIRCKDSNNNELNFDVTLTENEEGDIQSLLGRSDKISKETLKKNIENARNGKEKIRSLSLDDSNNILIKRIKKKINNRYGPNTALVIYDTSGIQWDRDISSINVERFLKSFKNPYDKGIWIVSKVDGSAKRMDL
ncbi:MAG: hypothetical protein JW871_04725 [Endomicrobiales bacterium]|nr:hypothetical protein [Endomicrobiales bacterium]